MSLSPRNARKVTSHYPTRSADRDRWIVERRGSRNPGQLFRPHHFEVEEERAESGEVISVAVVFLTNRECPWRCLMCDLWKNALTERVPEGAIPAQIDWALRGLAESSDGAFDAQGAGQGGLRSLRQIKLYNSGSFFDPQAIPPSDLPEVAARVRSFERVIVECHPALVNERALRFRDWLETRRDGLSGGAGPKLEIAMGLETAHPEVLEKLNKRMTLDQFERAAEFLKRNGIALRVFVLVRPPFLEEDEALDWAKRSVDWALDRGACVVSLIPTRLGNGALDALAERGQFAPPRLETLEAAAAYGVALKRGRVFADLWDLERFSKCAACFHNRARRLLRQNHRQSVEPRASCARCGGGGG